MTTTPLKAENIVDLGIELLKQEVVTPSVFWTVGESEFTKAKNDTVTIKIPAYTSASKRVMRSGTAITAKNFEERKVDVKIDTHLFHRTDMTSEELTLDITDFGEQILKPQVEAVTRGLDDECVDTITGATYTNNVNWNYSNPLQSVLRARGWLNRAHVPKSGRTLLVGPGIEENLLESEILLDASMNGGSSAALREATIGRVRGFNVVVNENLPDDVAVALHDTAFALVTRAPKIPAGAPMGATTSDSGYALRWLQVFEDEMVSDQSLVDLFCGTAVVTDRGHWDGAKNRFVPAEDVDAVGESDMFVRAVMLGTGVEESA
ncbi:P22 phage major capsid protein family protein [Glycomyces mayteni]|uniref:P22 phage major capsid protein family protein n=1 Tax=Glycomyces mayteni TaxID=543887 RepID=A0ABW2D210_9ACTN|nr:hypothetical protein GCM10025732_48250 [Glycomyces mayteni]